MVDAIRVCWRRANSSEVEVYVVLAEVEDDKKFFGMALDVRISAFVSTSERMVVRNAVASTLDHSVNSLLRNFLVKFSEFDKSVTKGWDSLWIKEQRRVIKAPALYSAWEELQNTKMQYMPKNWPLLGMKPVAVIEDDEEKEYDG